MMDLKEIGQRAKDASYILGTMDSQRKNEGLRAAARAFRTPGGNLKGQ